MEKGVIRSESLVGQTLTVSDLVDLLKRHSVMSKAYQEEITPESAGNLLKVKLEIAELFPFSATGEAIRSGPKLLELLAKEACVRLED